MINDFNITVSGIRELIAMNNALISELEEQTILEKMMDDIVNKAKELAPIKTGALISSLKWVKEEGKYAIAAIYYALFVEFGTCNIAVGDTESPRVIESGGGKTAYLPFIRPAVWHEIKNAKDTIQKLLDEIYKK
jgi:hypothetical protein